MQQIIDLESDSGQKFIRQIQKTFPAPQVTETLKNVVKIKDLSDYPFLSEIVTESTLKEFGGVVESVEIGHYGRKSGWSSRSDGKTFRIVIHLGDPDAYHYDNQIYPVTPGAGFILSPWGPGDIFVRKDPIQVFDKESIQKIVPKIRPRNYLRTMVVYYVSINFELQTNSEE